MNPELFNSEAWIRIQFRPNHGNSDSIQFNSIQGSGVATQTCYSMAHYRYLDRYQYS
jgi:hypothetical protein